MQESPSGKPRERVRQHPHPVQDARIKIDKTISYMQANYGRLITREQLAAIAGLNPEHYSRMFRKVAGTSPMDYLAGLRMERAKELLQQSRYSIVEIGQMVGYTDPYHFSRRFKQLIGVAPAHFGAPALPRVIALDGLGHCLALGIAPIAADLARTGGYIRVPDAAPIVDIGSAALQPQPDLARLRALRPDAIVTAHAELGQLLSEVAPAIRLDVLQDPIYGQLFAIADAVGRRQQAADWVEQYEAECLALRSRLFTHIGGERVAILRVREQMLQVYAMLNMGYPLYRSLQLAPPEKIAMQCLCNAHFHSSVIAIEELPFYEAEHLFVVLQPDEGAYEQWKAIVSSAAWHAFPAVRLGNVHRIEVANWLDNDPFSIQEQMREAAELLMAGGRHHNYLSWVQ